MMRRSRALSECFAVSSCLPIDQLPCTNSRERCSRKCTNRSNFCILRGPLILFDWLNSVVQQVSSDLSELTHWSELPSGQGGNKRLADLAATLVSQRYVQSKHKDIRLLVACSIADLLRVTAPEAPYSQEQLVVTPLSHMAFFLDMTRPPAKDAKKHLFAPPRHASVCSRCFRSSSRKWTGSTSRTRRLTRGTTTCWSSSPRCARSRFSPLCPRAMRPN